LLVATRRQRKNEERRERKGRREACFASDGEGGKRIRVGSTAPAECGGAGAVKRENVSRKAGRKDHLDEQKRKKRERTCKSRNTT
jgi:hypothetical protein